MFWKKRRKIEALEKQSAISENKIHKLSGVIEQELEKKYVGKKFTYISNGKKIKAVCTLVQIDDFNGRLCLISNGIYHNITQDINNCIVK